MEIQKECLNPGGCLQSDLVSSCDLRFYPTAYPCADVFIVDGNKALLAIRAKNPSKGALDIVGGFIGPTETPDEGAIREVKEECSLSITVIGVIDVVNKVIRDDRNAIKYHYVIIDYLARCQTDEPLNQVSSQPGTDVMDVRWIPLQEVTQYDLTEGLLRIIRAGVAMQEQWDRF